MRAVLLFSVLLGLVLGAQVLLNPEFEGCANGDGSPIPPWTGPYGSFNPFSGVTGLPPGDTCISGLAVSSNLPLTQTFFVRDTQCLYDFEALVACFGVSGGTCTYTLRINNRVVPLTPSSHTSEPVAVVSSIKASGIPLLRNSIIELSTTFANDASENYYSRVTLSTTASASGDPHLVGFQGQDFDFDGEAGKVYNILSDSNFQVNVELGLQQTGIREFIPGPVMMKMALSTPTDTVIVDCGGYLLEEIGNVKFNGALLAQNQTVISDNGELSVSFEKMSAIASSLQLVGEDHIVASVKVVLKGAYEFIVYMVENGRDKHNPNRWHFLPRRFLDFRSNLLDSSLRPHGILGQTAAPIPVRERSMEWKIEGTKAHYEVTDGLTGKAFAFNRFQ